MRHRKVFSEQNTNTSTKINHMNTAHTHGMAPMNVIHQHRYT